MKRLLLLLAALCAFATPAIATDVTVSSLSVPGYRWAGTTAKIRVYANMSFTDSSGVPHIAGTPGNQTGWYQEINSERPCYNRKNARAMLDTSASVAESFRCLRSNDPTWARLPQNRIAFTVKDIKHAKKQRVFVGNVVDLYVLTGRFAKGVPTRITHAPESSPLSELVKICVLSAARGSGYGEPSSVGIVEKQSVGGNASPRTAFKRQGSALNAKGRQRPKGLRPAILAARPCVTLIAESDNEYWSDMEGDALAVRNLTGTFSRWITFTEEGPRRDGRCAVKASTGKLSDSGFPPITNCFVITVIWLNIYTDRVLTHGLYRTEDS